MSERSVCIFPCLNNKVDKQTPLIFILNERPLLPNRYIALLEAEHTKQTFVYLIIVQTNQSFITNLNNPMVTLRILVDKKIETSFRVII